MHLPRADADIVKRAPDYSSQVFTARIGFDANVVDRYWDADVDRGWAMNQRLASVGLFGGQSSGIYLAGAYDVAKAIKKGVVVTLLCDIGERYMSTRLWDS